MEAKAINKELKKEVNELELKRNNDRTSTSWYELREAKKNKLIAKDKLNETKQ